MPDPAQTIDPSEVVQPPRPPDTRRAYRTTRGKALVLLLLAGIVVAALAGVFGERSSSARQSNASLGIDVEFPTRLRYKQIDSLRIVVENRSAETLGTLTIALDTGYLGEFSKVSAVPSFARVWEIDLHDVAPREARRVVVGVQGERSGLHRGAVSAFGAGSPRVEAPVYTFVFP